MTAGQVNAGTSVVAMECASAAGWDISPGSGSVVLTGTNLALDAGVNPSNNGALKVGSFSSLFTSYLPFDNHPCPSWQHEESTVGGVTLTPSKGVDLVPRSIPTDMVLYG